MDDRDAKTLDACGRAIGFLLTPLLAAIREGATPDPEAFAESIEELVYDETLLTPAVRAVLLGVMEGVSVALHVDPADKTARL